MQYNSDANNQDLISSITFYTAADTTDYPINDRTRNVNQWYHKAAHIMQSADGTWQWDDANNTTLPIGTTDLVSGQQDYSLDDAMLEIELVEIQASSGTWHTVMPIDISQFNSPDTRDSNFTSYKSTNGQPEEYDKRGRSLFLYPAPNYNSTGGLKIHFKRGANIFAVTDTTKEPGFAARFHNYLALGAAFDYCTLYKQDRVQSLFTQIQAIEKEMKEFYGRRNKDIRNVLRPHIVDTR